jgi:NTE family protein
MDREKLLRAVPLFDCLNSQEIHEIAGLFQEVTRLRGETVCREGEEGETLYIVLSGELEVRTGNEQEGRIINRMGPGDFFGEISILTGQTRSATVTVSRDARLWGIDRHSFEAFLRKNAKILEQLSKVMAQRLVRLSRGEIAARATTVISVIGPPGKTGKSLTACALAGLLGDFTGRPSVLVSFQSLRGSGRKTRRLPLLTEFAQGAEPAVAGHVKARSEGPAFLEIGIEKQAAEDKVRPAVGSLIEGLNKTFSFVVLEPDSEVQSLIASAAACSDFLVCMDTSKPFEMGDHGNNSLRVFRVINRLNKDSQETPINHAEPFVLPLEPAVEGMDSSSVLRYVRRHPRGPLGRPLQRLTRKILGTTVGVALGGGAAFGIAHVGVLRTLEENEIPVDLIAGTSMGSIVALGYAAGLSGSEMTDIALRVGTKWKTISALDLTLTRPGILRGNRLIHIFSPLLKNALSFDDLHLPCRTVATDIETGERITIKSGPLDMAFRSSCSVPLVISPVSYQGRVLADGAVVDPVPAEVVREMGADICLAVNVVPQLKKGVDTVLSRFYRKANRLNPLSYLSREPDLPNLLDILMNSIQTLQFELGNFKAISADVRINPDLSGYTWMEFYKPRELIERGAQATEQALPEIRRVMAEKLSQPLRRLTY